ncbi:hypothetical protein [Actinomadura sp. WAC 06369]|uniref:hypothetical protein n=1 Tax=Actinomadura sp. WAC 06369 TaxID=2203193 RepID=UPI000F7ADD6B|nr:hypothetical protein [Actinomadura sp. WAC 06369]RSN48282.1 hypothetical protein DMH08_34480 [Actinomadura sp. WAC 06369]
MEFVEYLDEVIRARTSHNRLIKAAGVGNGKLATYLNGEHVPDWRVVEHYILRPLTEGFTPAVRVEEVETLRRLHREACAVQAPRPPTHKDQIAFLEQDLAQAWRKRDEVQRRLDEALRQAATDRQHAAQLADVVTELRQQVESLTKEHLRLATDLASVKQEYGEVSRYKGRIIAEGQQKIAVLEQAMRDQHRTLDDLQQALDQHEQHKKILNEHTEYLRGEIALLHARLAEQRKLFMRLIVHLMNKPLGQILRRQIDDLERRLARQEKTIARLTRTNAHLAADLDRANAELDFLRAPLPATETAPLLVVDDFPEEEAS